MRIIIEVKNLDNVGEISEDKKEIFTEIFCALIESGGLTGVRGGSTNIHFDGDGKFQGIQLSYWPWRKRKT